MVGLHIDTLVGALRENIQLRGDDGLEDCGCCDQAAQRQQQRHGVQQHEDEGPVLLAEGAPARGEVISAER